MSPQSDSFATLSRLKQVDEICLHFEDAWRAGARPRLETYLESVPPADRTGLLGELLLVEWSYRVKTGDSFYHDEYGQRFAGHAEVTTAWDRWKEHDRSHYTTLPPTGKTLPPSGGYSLLPALPGYEQVERIGQGGMGEVFRAWDKHLSRHVALKRIHLEKESPERLTRFRTEAAALAKMRHPHIVGVHAFLEDAGQPILVMEYVANGSLSDRLGEKTPLPPADAARLVAVLAWAVHAAHEAGIAHRDLKPDNVLMADPVAGSPDNVLGGFPKVTDFGLAALADTPDGPTIDGAIFGTPAYMAPEQASGKTREIGPACDVWALGVILYRCLTGVVPFKGDSVLDTLDRVKAMQFEAPRKVAAGVPADLEAICLACLRKETGERPTAKDLAERLTRFVAGESFPTTVVVPSPGAVPPRWPWLVSAGVVLAASLFAVVLLVAKREKGPVTEPASVEAKPLRISFDVANFELYSGADQSNGTIGQKVFATRIDERVVVRAHLSSLAYCYLIGFNFDGKDQLLWPCDEDAKGDAERAPDQLEKLLYPPPTVAEPKGKREPRGIKLDDDRDGGLQAFLMVASQKPLPAYRVWLAARGRSPWSKLPPLDGVWRSSGETLDPVKPGEGLVRGSIVTLKGQPPLVELCRWAAGEDVVVEAIAFPVKKREGK